MPDHWLDAQPSVRLLAPRRTLAALGELAHGGRRYHGLHSALGTIAHNVLIDILWRAEHDGLVTRHVDRNRVGTATVSVRTDLTARKRTSCEVLAETPRSLDSSVTRLAETTGVPPGNPSPPGEVNK